MQLMSIPLPYFDELIDLRFYELLILFLRRQSRPSGNSQTITYHATSQNPTILTILNLIEEHIREPLQVADLARE